jgi:hypothetical protein
MKTRTRCEACNGTGCSIETICDGCEQVIVGPEVEVIGSVSEVHRAPLNACSAECAAAISEMLLIVP